MHEHCSSGGSTGSHHLHTRGTHVKGGRPNCQLRKHCIPCLISVAQGIYSRVYSSANWHVFARPHGRTPAGAEKDIGTQTFVACRHCTLCLVNAPGTRPARAPERKKAAMKTLALWPNWSRT